PFFHRADFYGPHHPYVVPEPYASMYDPEDVERPDSYAETFDGKPRVHENFLHYRGVADFDWDTWAEAVAKYRGFVTMIDDQLERILKSLEEHGLEAETAVVHASDHGDFVGGHRQFNKGPLMYDDTYRIPLQVRWPGVVEPGSVCEDPVHLHDLAATFLEMGGLEVPKSFHSRSLVPLLEGEDPEERPDSVFAQYHGDEFGLYTQRMVRTRGYKYVYNGPDIDELYDLEGDPAELQNLIDHPGYADVREAMRERLVDWMNRTEDPNRKWVPDVLRERD
ncbi:sulfatase, partial [Natronococcus amylolyticus DSM 10524]